MYGRGDGGGGGWGGKEAVREEEGWWGWGVEMQCVERLKGGTCASAVSKRRNNT